jgi:hypothetical protein
MTPEQRQEEISKAYVHAIAAARSFSIAKWSQDHGGIDTSIRADHPVGTGHLAKAAVDLQLKATTQQTVLRKRHVAWRLDLAHYDSLRRAASTPHLLVVLVLPPQLDQQIEHTVNELLLRKCAWWVNMTGKPAGKPNKSAQVTVQLPLTNVFSPAQLWDIMEKISQGQGGSL